MNIDWQTLLIENWHVKTVCVLLIVAAVIDGRQLRVPNWITFTPDSKTVYVSNSTLNSVSAIDVAAIKTVATIPVGQVPKRIGTLMLRDTTASR